MHASFILSLKDGESEDAEFSTPLQPPVLNSKPLESNNRA